MQRFKKKRPSPQLPPEVKESLHGVPAGGLYWVWKGA
jgi:hypothetical protein